MRNLAAAMPSARVSATPPTMMPRRYRSIQSARPGIDNARIVRRGARRGNNAGTISSVSTPQITMLWPISRPSSCRLGKSTNMSP